MIVTVVGARPQFVKAAVVSRALADRGLDERIIHTGQHYDDRMSDVFWRELGLPGVAVNLAVGSASHGAQTGQMMERIEGYLLSQAGVTGMLVYGDTNSTLAGALVAAKLGVPIFHVEAGLRSFDRAMPEEVNRVVTDHLSTLLFCPSISARAQLEREGIRRGVLVVGDVMLDALRRFSGAARDVPLDAAAWANGPAPRALWTVHRPSNTDVAGRLEQLVDAVGRLPHAVLWPVHPRVHHRLDGLSLPKNLSVCEPLSYLEMLRALQLTDLVLTDSGGLQKEAYWSHKPCVTLRAETEWTETLEGGWNVLAGEGGERLEAAVAGLHPEAWKDLYGDGTACDQIAQALSNLQR